MISLCERRRPLAFGAGIWLALLAFQPGVLPKSAPHSAPLPRVTRGAYLQMGTPTSIVVRWRTAVPTSSVVRYGTSPDKLEHAVTSPGRHKDHVVRLSGLDQNTVYFYAVGTSNAVLQGGPRSFFRTSPLPGSTRPIRVWVLGDPGTGFAVQRKVRDAYERSSRGFHTDLILTLGDNAYRDGTEAQYDVRFFDVYRDQLRRAVLWPAVGNHDTRSADCATQSGVYFDLFTLPGAGQAGGESSGTEAYYSFDHGNAHFICLNSEEADLSATGPMVQWLAGDLAVNQQAWTIAYWHHSPYSKGSHDSDRPTGNDRRMTEMRENVAPILESGGVDLVLCGHSHLYERSFPLRGHYGISATFEPGMIQFLGDRRELPAHWYLMRRKGDATRTGTVYVNAGSAGHATEPADLHGLNHPAMAVSLNVPGSLYLDIVGPRLRAVFLDAEGDERDHFVLIKEP